MRSNLGSSVPTSKRAVRESKLVGCKEEPMIFSFATKKADGLNQSFTIDNTYRNSNK